MKPLSGILCVLLPVLLGVQCHESNTPAMADSPVNAAAVNATALSEPAKGTTTTGSGPVFISREGEIATERTQTVDAATLAQGDPEAFVRYCRDEYGRRNVLDYTCRFTKQELIDNRLRDVEEVAVQFREEPVSVHMEWRRNPSAALKALYVKDAWVDSKGRQLGWFKPAGALIKLFVPKIKQPIHGARAKKGSRRSLDQFGFRGTLDLIIQYIERGRLNGDLNLRYVGEDSIGGRLTWVFERTLPFNGDVSIYPDALLRYHIDQEWLVPTACYSFADRNGQQLLGSYVITDVDFNVGLGPEDFDPDKIGF